MLPCFNPKKTFGLMFGCFPLALFGILICIILLVTGFYEAISAPRSDGWPNYSTVSAFIIAVVRIVAGILGFGACVFRLSIGARLVSLLLLVILFSSVFGFIIIVRFISPRFSVCEATLRCVCCRLWTLSRTPPKKKRSRNHTFLYSSMD